MIILTAELQSTKIVTLIYEDDESQKKKSCSKIIDFWMYTSGFVYLIKTKTMHLQLMNRLRYIHELSWIVY